MLPSCIVVRAIIEKPWALDRVKMSRLARKGAQTTPSTQGGPSTSQSTQHIPDAEQELDETTSSSEASETAVETTADEQPFVPRNSGFDQPQIPVINDEVNGQQAEGSKHNTPQAVAVNENQKKAVEPNRQQPAETVREQVTGTKQNFAASTASKETKRKSSNCANISTELQKYQQITASLSENEIARILHRSPSSTNNSPATESVMRQVPESLDVSKFSPWPPPFVELISRAMSKKPNCENPMLRLRTLFYPQTWSRIFTELCNEFCFYAETIISPTQA